MEFQQRGAPHIHSLVWLSNQADEEAPSFWVDSSVEENVDMDSSEMQEKFKEIENFASHTDMKCDSHENTNIEEVFDCDRCMI